MAEKGDKPICSCHACNISNYEVIETAPSLNTMDEPINSLVASASIPTLCFQYSIVQNRYWSQLPPELLQKIAIFITDISDLGRFCAVCTEWRSAVYVTRSLKRSYHPCLLMQCSGPRVFNSNLSFVSCSFSDSHADVHQLGTVPRRICGTGHGWLVIVSDFNTEAYKFSIFLLNPFTGIRIYLPSSASLVVPLSMSATHHAYTNSKATIALLEGSISPASGCVVMIKWLEHWGFSFCRYVGENHESKWITVETISPIKYLHDVSFAYHQGMILELHREKVLLVDINSLSRKIVYLYPLNIQPDVYRRVTWRIVGASSVVFLVVYKRMDSVAYVFRLDLTVQPPCWCPTKDIGNHVLFIDGRHLQCMKIEDDVKLNLRKNCIYFFKSEQSTILYTHKFYLYQLDKGIVEQLPLQFQSSSPEPRWLLPSLI